MIPTTSIVFDHRGRTKKNQEGPLEIRVIINRKPYYLATGIRVRRDEWKFGTVVNRADSDELNERLAILLRRTKKTINDCVNDEVIDIALIRRRVLNFEGCEVVNNDFLIWASERVEMMKATLAIGTTKHYYTLLNRLNEFGVMKSWHDVTAENVLTFDAWLHGKEKSLTDNQVKMGIKAQHIGNGCIYNYHKNLKHLLYIAVKVGKITQNPYALLRGDIKRENKETAEYLTEDEMRIIMDVKLQKGSLRDIVRDLFVVQMFTGMAYADLMSFDIINYKKVDGKWVNISERVKSGVAFVGHLLPPVIDVLKKYNMQLPRMTMQVYNRELKKIQEAAGLKTRLHSHLARHTFGTYMLANGVKIENLQRMMGHKDIKTTQRYAKTLAKSIHDEFDMVEKKSAMFHNRADQIQEQ